MPAWPYRVTTKYSYSIKAIARIDLDTAYVGCISVSLYGIRILSFSKNRYGIHVPLFSLYGSAAQAFERKGHCSGYGVATGCYGHCIVPRAATGMSQWYGRCWFMEYAGSEREPRHGDDGLPINHL